MPIFRGPSGEIRRDEEEISTRKIHRNANNNEPPTIPISPEMPMTRDLHGHVEPKTKVFFGSQAKTSSATEPLISTTMADPVVGWVVIVEGPGKGIFLPLGYGMNSLGRDKSERVCLDFGDEGISRTQHAIITYDPRGRQFYVQHGGGKNLTYLGDQPLLMPAPLQSNAEILLSQTKLRFVPFCGENFDWQDNS
jgi:hypothetical protein